MYLVPVVLAICSSSLEDDSLSESDPVKNRDILPFTLQTQQAQTVFSAINIKNKYTFIVRYKY